jgi:hypothetical protein
MCRGKIGGYSYLYNRDICSRHTIALQITNEPCAVLSNRADEAHRPACTGDSRGLIGAFSARATLEFRRRDCLSWTNDVLDYRQRLFAIEEI